jgi:hypothetical protein
MLTDPWRVFDRHDLGQWFCAALNASARRLAGVLGALPRPAEPWLRMMYRL